MAAGQRLKILQNDNRVARHLHISYIWVYISVYTRHIYIYIFIYCVYKYTCVDYIYTPKTQIALNQPQCHYNITCSPPARQGMDI
jgi:hypothetical protein